MDKTAIDRWETEGGSVVMRRLSFRVPDELYILLTSAAEKENKTVADFVVSILEKNLGLEDNGTVKL